MTSVYTRRLKGQPNLSREINNFITINIIIIRCCNVEDFLLVIISILIFLLSGPDYYTHLYTFTQHLYIQLDDIQIKNKLKGFHIYF